MGPNDDKTDEKVHVQGVNHMKPKRKERLNTDTKQKKSSVYRMEVKKNRKEINNKLRSGYYDEDDDYEDGSGGSGRIR